MKLFRFCIDGTNCLLDTNHNWNLNQTVINGVGRLKETLYGVSNVVVQSYCASLITTFFSLRRSYDLWSCSRCSSPWRRHLWEKSEKSSWVCEEIFVWCEIWTASTQLLPWWQWRGDADVGISACVMSSSDPLEHFVLVAQSEGILRNEMWRTPHLVNYSET